MHRELTALTTDKESAIPIMTDLNFVGVLMFTKNGLLRVYYRPKKLTLARCLVVSNPIIPVFSQTRRLFNGRVVCNMGPAGLTRATYI